MAWTAIKTWLPQETLTSAELNTYLRDNQLATLAGPAPIANGIASSAGPGQAQFRAIVAGTKTTTSTTSSTTPVDVGPSSGLTSIANSGTILVMTTAEISNSSTSFTNFAAAPTSGTQATISKAVRTASTERLTLSCHVLFHGVINPVSITGWLWTDNGATTASVYNAQITVIPL